MQGENWSPNGEARNLIGSLGLSHTSMSVGDIIEIDGNLFFVDRHGFKKLVNGSVTENIKLNEGENKKMAKKLTEKQLRERIKRIFKEEKQKLKEEAGEVIGDKIDEPEDVEPKKDVYAGGENLENPMDWIKALGLPKAEGKKLVSAVKRIVKEELQKKN